MLVTLTYFKQSGKYYTEGRYKSTLNWLFEIVREVKEFKRTGALPGLTPGGGKEFHILIQSKCGDALIVHSTKDGNDGESTNTAGRTGTDSEETGPSINR